MHWETRSRASHTENPEPPSTSVFGREVPLAYANIAEVSAPRPRVAGRIGRVLHRTSGGTPTFSRLIPKLSHRRHTLVAYLWRDLWRHHEMRTISLNLPATSWRQPIVARKGSACPGPSTSVADSETNYRSHTDRHLA